MLPFFRIGKEHFALGSSGRSSAFLYGGRHPLRQASRVSGNSDQFVQVLLASPHQLTPFNPLVQQNIGHISPEVLNSFPRKWDSTGLTVQDVRRLAPPCPVPFHSPPSLSPQSIVTGFESVFAYRKPTASQQASLTALLKSFAHPALTPSFLTRLFASLTPGEQSLVLLLRALVKSPKLLVLDEPFAGMDAETVRISRRYLDERVGDDVAVVLVTHFDEEVLESVTKVARLEVGRIVEVV